MAERVIPKQWVNMETGELTMEAIRYLNDLDNGGSNSIGTLLAGVNSVTTRTNAIIAGTQPLADVLITGLGSVTGAIVSTSTNISNTAAAASAGALTASASAAFVSGDRVGAGSVTTDAVTITAAGGTGPYTYAWTSVEGLFPANSATAATTTFTRTLTNGQSISTIQRCTVTDAVAATFEVDVTVSGFSTAA
jgi:hypothetical protein